MGRRSNLTISALGSFPVKSFVQEFLSRWQQKRFGMFLKTDQAKPYKFPHKDDFPHEEIAEKRKWILNHLRTGMIGAEFGVFRGHFSRIIMRDAMPSKLYLVDPWTKFGEKYNWGRPEDTPYTNYNELTTEEAKIDAMHRLSEYGDAVEFIEDFEENFCRSFIGKLDFVYLDSSHWYEPSLRTLIMIDRILSDDGVVFGDDWYTAPDHYSGVCRAVNDFIRNFD